MTLYEYVLEIQDGTNVYTQTEYVLAQSDVMASQFARNFAQHWKPNATYDDDLDIYSASCGFPQWTLAHCAPVTHLNVPVAGTRSKVHVALVLEIERKK
jgi:hypothetical protein